MKNTCPEGLNAYFDHELDPVREKQFEKHFSECADCQATLDQMHILHDMLISAPEPQGLSSEEQFLSELKSKLQMSGQSIHGAPPKNSVLLGIPLLLIFSLVAWQLLGWIMGMVDFIPGLSQIIASLFPANLLVDAQINGLANFLRWIPNANILWVVIDWNWINQILYLVMLVSLYSIWTAWWFLRQRPEWFQSFKNNQWR